MVLLDNPDGWGPTHENDMAVEKVPLEFNVNISTKSW